MKYVLLGVKLFFGFTLITLIAVFSFMYFSVDVSLLERRFPKLTVTDGEVSFELSEKAPAYWVSLNAVSRDAVSAIVLSEDWSFYEHAGIDISQIKVALEDMISGKRYRGASTITQQTIKNIFLSSQRTLWRKVHEAVLAMKLERSISKKRILEIYLNSIQFGPKIYGIKAATWHYFGVAPAKLGPREGAFLAMLLPSPQRYYVSFKRKKLSTFARARIETILEKLRIAKVITPEQYRSEVERPFNWEAEESR